MNIPKGFEHLDISKKRNSLHWQMLLCPDTIIIDPDGWDRTPENWYHSFYIEEISIEEFSQRLIRSSTNNLSAESWFLPQDIRE